MTSVRVSVRQYALPYNSEDPPLVVEGHGSDPDRVEVTIGDHSATVLIVDLRDALAACGHRGHR